MPSGTGTKRLRLSLNGNGRFNVHPYYEVLQVSTVVFFPWKSIWCAKATKRIALFVRTEPLEKIMQMIILWSWGYNMVNWCLICRRSGDTVSDLLLHSDDAHYLQPFVFSMFGAHLVILKSVVDLLSVNWFGKHSTFVWNLFGYCGERGIIEVLGVQIK